MIENFRQRAAACVLETGAMLCIVGENEETIRDNAGVGWGVGDGGVFTPE